MWATPGYLQRSGYRLPTEAEWEYACRGGSLTSRPFGRSDALLPRYAWFADNAQDQTQPVGSFPGNDLGLFDVLGNAEEWVQDIHKTRHTPDLRGRAYEARDELDVLLVTNDRYRVVRGGDFESGVSVLRSSSRSGYRPDTVSRRLGFRIARTLPAANGSSDSK